jgi:hypothetical protein
VTIHGWYLMCLAGWALLMIGAQILRVTGSQVVMLLGIGTMAVGVIGFTITAWNKRKATADG